MKKKQFMGYRLQPYERDVVLYFLYFTIVLVFSMYAKQWGLLS